MNSLFDVLATATAFVTVMALLSLVVTACVQGTQSALQLRWLNFRIGLRDFMRFSGRPMDGEEVLQALRRTIPTEKPRDVTHSELVHAMDTAQERRTRGAGDEDAGPPPSLISEQVFKRFEESLASRFRLWTKFA